MRTNFWALWRPFAQASCLALLVAILANSSRGEEPAAAGGESLPLLTVATTRFGELDLMTLDVAGKNAVQITKDLGGAVQPTWSPDGKQIAFTSYSSGTGQICVMNADGTNLKNLSNNGGGDRNPQWSPDGQQIAFCATRSGHENVWKMKTDGSQAKNVTGLDDFDSDPAWSPDGKRLAFVSRRTGKFRLWTMNADGTEPSDPTKQDQSGGLYPTWSSDGKQIVFGSRGEKGKIHLFVLNADGSNMQQLTHGEERNCSYASWSPDGQYIAYIRFQRWPYHLAPPNKDAGTGPDDVAPDGDLMIYDTIEDTHTEISHGDISMWGPRPSWKPAHAVADKVN